MHASPSFDLSDERPEATLAQQGFALLGSKRSLAVCGIDATSLERLARTWEDLPADEYLRDGGHYRSRRHASLILSDDATQVLETVRRAHWQSTDYNALHGGIERWFAPIEGETLGEPAMLGLITGIGMLFTRCAGHPLRFVEVHQFRIDTEGGIGRPTPEGAHRDGVDFVAVVLIARQSVRGGETRVFQASSPSGLRFTMIEPGSALLLDDCRVIHETTPVQPDGTPGHRDTLVLTYRNAGFQNPEYHDGLRQTPLIR